jgi:serine/threonine protein kinase
MADEVVEENTDNITQFDSKPVFSLTGENIPEIFREQGYDCITRKTAENNEETTKDYISSITNELLLHTEDFSDLEEFANELGWDITTFARIAKPVGVELRDGTIITYEQFNGNRDGYISDVLSIFYPNYGKTFQNFVDEHSLNDKEIASLSLQAVRTLAYLNSKGILHRDITEDNILVDSSGIVTIIDFAHASKLDEGGLPYQLNNVAVLGHNDPYTPPEAFIVYVKQNGLKWPKTIEMGYKVYKEAMSKLEKRGSLSFDDFAGAKDFIDALKYDSFAVAQILRSLGVKWTGSYLSSKHTSRKDIFQLAKLLEKYPNMKRREIIIMNLQNMIEG